jgi:beta-lactamase regulating signal transducer with metallopeptidase domain
LWIGTVTAAAAMFVLSLLGDRYARHRYALAYGGLVAMVIGPLAMAVSGADPITAPVRRSLLWIIEAGVGGPAFLSGRAVAVAGAAVVWAAGLAAAAFRLRAAWLRVRALGRTGDTEDAASLAATADDLARALGLRVGFAIRRSPGAAVPLVLGWSSPIVILPPATERLLTRAQMRAVLAHELTHIRRRDYLANLAQIALETMLWHHPGARWLSNRIRVEREYCCDDVAVRVSGDAAGYARALAILDEARAPFGARVEGCRLLVAAASGTLLDRIQRIAGVPRRVLTPARALVAVIAAAMAAAAIAALVSAVPPGLPLNVKMRSRSAAPPATPVSLSRREGSASSTRR